MIAEKPSALVGCTAYVMFGDAPMGAVVKCDLVLNHLDRHTHLRSGWSLRWDDSATFRTLDPR